MKYLGYIAEAIAAAFLAAFLLSQVSFAEEKCVDEYYAIRAGTLKHTCDNRFYVNSIPLKKWVRQWIKNRKNKENPSSVEELDEVFSTVTFLEQRWKDQQKQKR